MNVSGVFPIDGDCERFLMCRKDRGTSGKIKGKVYKCPKGELLIMISANSEILVNITSIYCPTLIFIKNWSQKFKLSDSKEKKIRKL